MSQVTARPRIDLDRLRRSVLAMAAIGATPAGGVTRLTLTDEDRAARDLFAAWCAEIGLVVRVDDMGTQYARYEGREPDLAPVLIGSHLDSVPAGGKYDGPLGVLTGLEVVRTLAEAGIRGRRPIEIVNFTNEEGARFEPAMIASGVLAGRYTLEMARACRDAAGLRLGDELDRIGYRGDAANRIGPIHAYIELHIEQGPVLEAERIPLGAVTGILGIRWYDLVLRGQAQHAGPSPMRTRRDAMVAAGRIIVGLRDLALTYPDPVVATVGRLRPSPGVINQIPGEVVMSADVRHWTDEGLAEIASRAEALMDRVAAEEGVTLTRTVVQHIPPTHFDPRLVERIARAIAAETGAPARRLVACAAHDAKYVNDLSPTAMVFVRTIGGKSHCESEEIEWADAGLGGEVLLRVVLDLANEDEVAGGPSGA